ncbi:hypothetical protein AVEN_21988-1 [Araneus ventricosus]|uniref:Mutator-like transposase domain-containing protein n=2 Tax=Araneus ventricosus TaxID=182803 RepID=A0A4Y2JE50_ARAVE|nr:hypothetical protein AVEN_21988-1 [Araneus ventricosus]
MAGFTSTPKENKKCSLNTLLVFGLRLMGRGFSAGMKLLCTLNLPYVCKKTFRIHELKLLEAVKYSCEENMKAASKEVQNLKKTTTCGVSVDGTWQRRGHMSLNGCVSVISIDTGKILDLEVMTQYCKMCEMNIKCDHECSNYKGSSGNMESVGAFRIFERSVMKRELQYTEYYGDGDSKAFLKVKDIYGEDTVTKLECIGHVQKRVGSRLRKLKKNPKDSVEKNLDHSRSEIDSILYLRNLSKEKLDVPPFLGYSSGLLIRYSAHSSWAYNVTSGNEGIRTHLSSLTTDSVDFYSLATPGEPFQWISSFPHRHVMSDLLKWLAEDLEAISIPLPSSSFGDL